MENELPIDRMRRRLLAGAAAGAAGWPLAALAQGLSNRPVHIIVAQTAGTTPDVIARVLAPRLQKRWNQPFIVENRAGAAGAIGMEALARAAPDGHTVQVMVASILTLPLFFQNLPFDILKSFQPIGMIGNNNFALVVHGSLPVSNVKEFIAYAKAFPGELDYGSPGNGTIHHLLMEQLKLMTGINARHIPYKGAAPAYTDLLGGRIQVMFAAIHIAMALSKDGKIKVIGGTMRERSPLFPDLPSIHEQGVTGFNTSPWFALLGPAGMPANVVAKYNTELRAILAEPDMKDILGKQGVSIETSSPEEMGVVLKEQFAALSKLVHDANIKGD